MVARATTRLAILVFGSVLSGTVLIPSVRPLCAALYPGHPGAAHAFLTMAVLGGVIGGPLLAARADRRGQAARLAIARPRPRAGWAIAPPRSRCSIAR